MLDQWKLEPFRHVLGSLWGLCGSLAWQDNLESSSSIIIHRVASVLVSTERDLRGEGWYPMLSYDLSTQHSSLPAQTPPPTHTHTYTNKRSHTDTKSQGPMRELASTSWDILASTVIRIKNSFHCQLAQSLHSTKRKKRLGGLHEVIQGRTRHKNGVAWFPVFNASQGPWRLLSDFPLQPHSSLS